MISLFDVLLGIFFAVFFLSILLNVFVLGVCVGP